MALIRYPNYRIFKSARFARDFALEFGGELVGNCLSLLSLPVIALALNGCDMAQEIEQELRSGLRLPTPEEFDANKDRLECIATETGVNCIVRDF